MKTQRRAWWWLVVLAVSVPEVWASPTVVNLRTSGPDPRNAGVGIICRYTDILKQRPALNPNERPIDYIELSPDTALKPEDHSTCEMIFTNGIRLYERQTREEMAKIIKDIPCKPGVPLRISFSHTENEPAQRAYNYKTAWVTWKIAIWDCLQDDNGENMDLPQACRVPQNGSPAVSLIDYDLMIATLRRCRDAITKKVKDEKLQEHWAAQEAAAKARTASSR